jgi:hypothetical protein
MKYDVSVCSSAWCCQQRCRHNYLGAEFYLNSTVTDLNAWFTVVRLGCRMFGRRFWWVSLCVTLLRAIVDTLCRICLIEMWRPQILGICLCPPSARSHTLSTFLSSFHSLRPLPYVHVLIRLNNHVTSIVIECLAISLIIVCNACFNFLCNSGWAV